MVQASFILACHSKSPATGFTPLCVGRSMTEEVLSGTPPPPYSKDSSGLGPPYIFKRIQAASALLLLQLWFYAAPFRTHHPTKSNGDPPTILLAGYRQGGLNGNNSPPPRSKLTIKSGPICTTLTCHFYFTQPPGCGVI